MIAEDFFTIESSWKFFEHCSPSENPCFWVKRIDSALAVELKSVKNSRRDIPAGCYVGDNVFIHESVRLPPICVIEGPAYIDKGTTIRPFAYLRQNVIVGENCIIGNSCEIKNSILLGNVQVPHFNYVGDSVLGNFVHLGAGVILANLRLDKGEVVANYKGERMHLGVNKFGAIIGDHSEIACNSVLNPGTILPKYSMVFGGNSKKIRE
ncbi:MAG: UDP-N-acetylglucosamine diphosphorylase [Puniceicoccales bacterium]|jgi:NDP-sugar pyrophosphorylase family protein|nr:UDP-N-acetylglucosamine diphosphorylase [Puniceicoccales bacterium]